MDFMVDHIVLFLLVFVRVTAVVAVAPFFSHGAVPAQVKVALAMFLSFLLQPMMEVTLSLGELQLPVLVLMVIKEAGVGLLIGFAATLIFAGVRSAGELMGFELGFSLANAFDPENAGQTQIVAQFLNLIMILVFLLLNGHHFVLQALRLSFDVVPLGGLVLRGAIAEQLISLTATVIVVAVKLAAPVIVAGFLVNVAMAILTRVAPQIHVFILSFPLRSGVGLLVLALSGSLMVVVFKKLLLEFEGNILMLVRSM
jgi:flagellar biosynthetic protein FliR